MKKLFLFLMLMFFSCFETSLSFATTVDTKASGSTVSFTNAGIVVSFNSVTNYIKIQNNSSLVDCYVDIECRDINGKRGYLSRNQNESATILLPRAGASTANTITLDFATQNLGFMTTAGTGSVSYVVTGDLGDL